MPAADAVALPLLRRVAARAPWRLAVVWDDGRESEIDLAPHLLRYRVYRPLRADAKAFKTARIVDDGVAVAWPDLDLDVSADALAALDRAQAMTADEFRRRLTGLGLSFDAAAATFDISRRQIAYYAAGEKRIPRHVVLALRGFETEMGRVS